MKRHIRHMLSPVSAVMMLLVALFVVVPQDVCISKVAASATCACAPSSTAGETCCCCNDSPASLMCDTGMGHAPSGDASTESGSDCFSVSADQAQVTPSERVPVPAPAFAVLAVLPLPLEVSAGQPEVSVQRVAEIPARDEVHLHRDNCVFLI